MNLLMIIVLVRFLSRKIYVKEDFNVRIVLVFGIRIKLYGPAQKDWY